MRRRHLKLSGGLPAVAGPRVVFQAITEKESLAATAGLG
jgi:hypothetical protein